MTEFGADITKGHPEYGQLLALMDRDPAQGGQRVRAHVRECAKCRQDMDDCRAAVLDYARYEETIIVPAIPLPVPPWLDLRAAMRETEQSRKAHARIGGRIAARLASGAGRIAAGGTVLGCLAFAIVLATHVNRRAVETAAAPSSPVVMAPPSSFNLDSRPAIADRPHRPVDAAPPALESLLNTEVRVFAALHGLGADLGEPVEIESAAGKIVVGGAGVTPSRQTEIRAALAAEPDVAVRFTETPHTKTGATQEPARTEMGRSSLEAEVKNYAGNQSAYESLSNRVLDESDAALARAHALRTLEERFPAGRQRELHDDERQSLDAMIADHRAAFEEHARAELALIAPLSKALGAPAPAEAQPGDVLETAQRMDRVLSAIFGAARTGLTSQQLLAELSNASAALAATLGGRP